MGTKTTDLDIEILSPKLVQDQLQKGVNAAREASKDRGYKLHPKLQKKEERS